MDKEAHINFWYIVVAMLLLLVAQAWWEETQRIETIRIDPQFAKDLAAHNVEFSGVLESNWLTQVLSWVLPAIVFVGIWLFLVRKMAEKQGMGGMMSVGKSKAKIYVEKDTRVCFDDVAGVDGAKEELEEIVAFLKDPGSYGRLGAHVPKGVLLAGRFDRQILVDRPDRRGRVDILKVHVKKIELDPGTALESQYASRQ